ncbi:hypothetical protein JCM10207_004604 [Rhodosporidiobolus poonsookiae]
MSGADPNEASFAALAHEANAIAETKTTDPKVGYSFDEKRATSPSAPSGDVAAPEYDDAPTDEELKSLRRVPNSIELGAFLLGFIELCERFSYYGCSNIFTNFIQRGLPEGSTTGSYTDGQRGGALGLGQQASTGLTTFNQFWVYCCPLFGAWLADTYLGKFKTISIAVGIALVGHVLLVASAAPSVIQNPNSAVGCFAVAIIIMGLGTGMFKSTISPLVAEQVASHRMFVKTTKKGERVIVDPAATAARMYNWYYMCVNVGALAGQLGMAYTEKDYGFWLAFLLPTVIFALCPIVLVIGRKRYVHTPPAGESVLTKAFRTLWVCFKKAGFSPKNWYATSFWQPAYEMAELPAEEKPKGANWDAQWVSEVRRGFKACQVFAYLPLYWLCYNQINNNLVSQAAVLNVHGLPSDVLANLDPFALIILIPIFDLFIYPAFRRFRINFSPLRKICLGFLVGALSMMCAAIVQNEIYKRSACGRYAATCEEEPFIQLNVWVQTPSYVLLALSEIFASITSLEYAYTKAPRSMRSMVQAIALFMTALAAAIGEAFLPISADPNLVWNYGVMAVLATLGGIAFAFNFRHLDKEEDSLNQIEASNVVATKVSEHTNAREHDVAEAIKHQV